MSPETIAFAARGAVTLNADLYRAEGAVEAPLLVAVHGGAWRRGSRDQLGHWGRHLAANGISVLAIDYRKSEDGPSYPGNVEDVRDAWLFARDNAAALGADPDRIGFLGASAGAHLAALAALTTAATPSVLVLAYGVYDLVAHWHADLGRAEPGEDPTERMMGGSFQTDPKAYTEASPQHRITGAAVDGLEALIIWGEADDAVLPSQSRNFAAALSDAGARVETLPVPDAGHFWFSRDAIDDPAGHTAKVAGPVVDFLKKAFGA